jgi:hypothetical protein
MANLYLPEIMKSVLILSPNFIASPVIFITA